VGGEVEGLGLEDEVLDGEPDVVVAGNDDTVTALGGNTGSVLWQSFLPGDQIYRKCLATAALGGDAADDVVVGSDDGIVRALDGSDGSLLWSVNLGGDIEEVEVADMNGSGPDDVVAVAGWPGNRLAVIDGSDGSILWEYDQDMDYARHVEVLDTNGDGIPDVAVGVPVVGAGDGRVFVLDGISHAEVWSAPMTFNSDYGLAHGDLDGDGRDDVVAAGNSTDRTVHALDGDDGLPLWMHPTGGDVNVVRVVDLDRDGRSEVVAGSDDQIVRVLDGCSGEEILSLTTAGDVMDVAAGDISGDGLPNLAAVTFDSDGVAYVLRPLEERVVIVDQSDAEFVIVDGSWPERSYRKAIDGSLAFRRPGTGGNRAAWRVDNSGGAPFLTPGTYDVFTWKFEHPRLHRMATNAPFRVYHAGGNSPWIRVDQSAPNDSWLYLGTFAFDNDSPQGVLVSDDADGVVAADAVRFIRR